MVTRPRLPFSAFAIRLALLTVMVSGAAGCQRNVQPLDEVTRVAYAVKPAVVRINAFATASFRYDPDAIRAAASELGLEATNIPSQPSSLATGAGGSGSGFIINPDGLILTSGHVVAPTRDPVSLQRDLLHNGAIATLLEHFPLEDLRARHRDDKLDQSLAMLASRGSLADVQVVNEVELSNGEKLPFTVLRFTPALHERGTDVALLRVSRKDLPAIPLGDSDATRVGETIYSAGYPAVASSTDEVIGGWLSHDSDLEATFTRGTITAIKRDVTNTPVFQSDVAIYRGNSGGPAVNHDGEAIAISTWGHTGAESIKFLVPINVARATIAAAGVKPSADSAFNRHYRAALEASADGDWQRSQTELSAAAALFPRSPDLIRFRRDADRALLARPQWRQYPYLFWGIACAILLVLIIGSFFAFNRRRKRGSSISERMIAPVGRDDAAGANGSGNGRILGKFTILNGTRAGEKLGLGGSGIRIGRESSICEIVLENPKVSRLHAEVVSIDGKVLLIDRNSSNGTFVNDHKIDKRFLKDGDIIYFGGRNAVAVAFHA
jgi:S1-C subfamily serine protease